MWRPTRRPIQASHGPPGDFRPITPAISAKPRCLARMNTLRIAIANSGLVSGMLVLMLVLVTSRPMAQSIPASAEDVVRESDAIVLGKVTKTDREGIEIGSMKQLFTRHSFAVEAWYKGSGPKEISVLTPGGFWTSHEGGKKTKHLTEAVGAVGIDDGDEVLAFLRSIPEGYIFVQWDGAKHPVLTDDETGERSTALRLRKKQYMRGQALEAFKRLKSMETEPDSAAKAEARLVGPRFIIDVVSVRDLGTRMEELVRGETNLQSAAKSRESGER